MIKSTKSHQTYIILSVCCLLLATLYYAINQEWLIINIPTKQSRNTSAEVAQKTVQRKAVTLFFWHAGDWHKESIDLIWSDDTTHNITYLVSSWLTLLDEEQIVDQRVTLQDSALTTSGTVLLSFDRTPFNEASSTYEKLMWLEGLLQTIRENETTIQSVYFLVHHQPMQDYHLDFSNPWPVIGYLG